MPIRKELRHLYGRKWRTFRLELIEERGYACSKCGRVHGMINAAHTTHDPMNPASIELMCPSCHARHDAKHRIAIMRRTKSKEVGQQWLSPEFEYAPFAGFEIPGRIFDQLAQMRLFEQQ